jgi:hydrogenase maturation protease
VIGYGNSLAGDDAVGFYTVQKLVGLELPAGVKVKYVHQLMPEHAEEISENDIVIFIDAEISENAGELRCRKISCNELFDSGSSSHEYTLDSILLLTQQLYGKIPVIYLITVVGSSFLTGDSLSMEVENRISDVVNNVFEIINSIYNNV